MRNFIRVATPPPKRATIDSANHSTRTALRVKTAVGDAVAITQRVLNRLWVIAIVLCVFFVAIGVLIAFG